MTTITPTLFCSPGACSLAPHILLEEQGKPFRLEWVITDKGEARAPKFHKLNPKGRVPVLVRGEWILTEIPAILMHLSAENPDVAPKGHEELLRSLEWLNWLSGTVHSVAIRQIWRSEYFTNDPATHQAIQAKGFDHLNDAHEMIEKRLLADEWVLGSGYTMLDPYLLVFYRWGNRMNIIMRDKYPKWTKHAEMMLERPAVSRALKTEDISIWE